MKVADFLFIQVGKVICDMKLFANKDSKNGLSPAIYLYLIRYKLKSPTNKLLLFSGLILLRSFSIKPLLN